jgi:CRISPR-associated protein Cas2
MKYLIPYDISHDKRRSLVVKVLKMAGIRVQKSIFEVILNNKQLHILKDELCKIISDKEDCLLILPICKTCERQKWLKGQTTEVEMEDIIII